ncbi:MAG: hypothetical protein KatS3mg093_179 [Candidatus Parcubacteria bacterium]|nr:MAG: hypothetical protein KatS3mg093_179 [Candidatus Parcubacteria bacterium]
MLRYFFFVLLVSQIVLGQNLLITEIMYDPEGNDRDREWIEVINNSSSTIFIQGGRDGWRLNDGQNHLFKDGATILAGEIFIITPNAMLFKSYYSSTSPLKILESNFNLKNSEGEIKILDKDKKIVTQAFYSSAFGAKGNGLSLNWINDKWQEAKISPGFLLDLNNNDISNREENFSATKTEVVFSNSSGWADQADSFSIIINEFFPNPDGNDMGQEFVELYNLGDKEIDLNNFWLEINNKKQSLSGKIGPGEYFLIKNNQNIRNNGEKLVIFWQNQKVFEIAYQGKAPSGLSFARNKTGKWQFTQPTPGKENIFNDYSESSPPKDNFLSMQINSSDEQKKLNTSLGQNKNNQMLTLVIGISLILILTLIVWLKI